MTRILTFGEWIRQKRIEAGLTATQAADKAQMTLSVWSRWENDESRRKSGEPSQPKMETLTAIARGLGVSIETVAEASFIPLAGAAPDIRFAREMEPILMKAGKRRHEVERLLKRQAEDYIRLLTGSAA